MVIVQVSTAPVWRKYWTVKARPSIPRRGFSPIQVYLYSAGRELMDNTLKAINTTIKERISAILFKFFMAFRLKQKSGTSQHRISAPQVGLEPTTYGLTVRRSNQLSY